MIRRFFSWSDPKVPAGQGSIWTSDLSTIPRRSSAAFHSGIGPQRADDLDRLLDLQVGPDVRHLDPAVDHAAGDRHDRLDHRRFGPLQEHGAHPAIDRHRLAAVMGVDERLRRIAQADVGEADFVGGNRHPPAVQHDLAGSIDLVPVERGQWVAGWWLRGGGHARP